MWSQIFLCFFVGLAFASQNPGWKDNSEYVYQVRGRSLASLHQVSNDYTGIYLKAKLIVRTKSDGNLNAKFEEPQYAQFQAKLNEGWDSYIPDSQLSYQQLPISTQPFEIVMKNGAVHDVIVNKQISNWEANIIKSIVSQFQLDTQAENLIPSHINVLAKDGSNTAVYKTMEETVTGVCETLYEIHPLPEYVLQTKPELAPLKNLKGDGEMIEIVKSKNYTRSDERPSYHFGLHGVEDFELSNQMGNFISRSSVSRAVISGNWNRYTVQSSVTVDQIVIRPTMTDKEMGSVNTLLNVTLLAVQQQSQQPQEVSNPVSVGLVYRFNQPYGQSNEARQGQQYQHQQARGSSESYGDASEENQYKNSMRTKRGLSNSHQYYAKSYNFDSEQSGSVEEEYWQQDQPRLNEAPESPLLPLTVGYQGQSIKKQQNIVENVQKLAQQIGQELQRPNDIPKQNTVGKFVILTSLLRVMSQNEMQQVVSQLYTKEQQGAQAFSWIAFRDAVAQCGTGPALVTIQDWIKSNKISGEEAAEIIATAARATRQPTEEYMKAFFQMIQADEVMKQRYLNESVLLAYTKLVHQVYVHKEVSHGKYPVHSFGSFRNSKGQAFLKNQLIPYLTKQLQEAVSNADTHKIHTYIRALGNLGHQQILEAFEPYLEGEQQVSQFQRVLMVMALDKLAKTNPKVARSVLYKIYQNPSDYEQVRVAAVHQLMRTNPSADMLQRMATYTNIDPNHYVNSAVKSAIKSASKLQGSEYAELRANAQSAKSLLTEEKYGAQYCHDNFRSYVTEQMQLSYKQTVQTFGGEDSMLPRGIKYHLRGRFGGVKQHIFTFQAIVSSVDDLINVFQQQTKQYQQQQQQKQSQNSQQHEWSAEHLAQLLNMQNDQREQLEGNLYLRFGALQKILSFDNQTIENLPQMIREIEESLKNGEEFHYSKMYNHYETALAFPTELGLPFIYTYDKPILVNVHGHIKASANPQVSSGNVLRQPEIVNSEFEIRALVTGRTQSKFGFITPFDHQRYSAGYDKNLQILIPVRGNIQVDVQNNQVKAEIEGAQKQEQENLLHFSTWPYIAKNNIFSPKPETQVIRKQHQQRVNKVFGQKSTGIALHLQMTSDQHLDAAWVYDKFRHQDLVSALLGPWVDQHIQHTEINVGIDSSESSTNKVQVQLGYQHKYESRRKDKSNASGSDAEISKFNEISNEPLKRQHEFIRRSCADIDNAEAGVIDATVVFQGQNQIKYTATAAAAKSNADPKGRFLVQIKKYNQQGQQLQFALSAKTHVPNTNGLDLTYAMQMDPTSVADIEAAFSGNDQKQTKINAHVKFSKSEERKQYLQEQPEYHECQRQMQEGNHQLPVCAKMTARANLLDKVSIKITHDGLSPQVLNGTYKLYSIMRHCLYPRVEENINKDAQSEGNNVDIQGRFSPDLSSANFSLQSQYGKVHIKNIPVNDWARNLFVPHPVFHAKARLMAHVFKYDTYRPICVVDKTAASTWDNKTYPLKLENDWTVVLQYVPQRPAPNANQPQQTVPQQLNQEVESYAVYVRASEQGSSQKEIKIVVQSPHTQGKIVEIALKPSGSNQAPKLFINKEEIKYNNQQGSDIFGGYMQVYTLPNNEMKLEIYDAFYVIFDGVRAKLTAVNDKFLGASRGLCGTFTGEPETDFLAPNNCILRYPEEFVASYTILKQGSQNQRISELQNSANKKCYQKHVQYANVISSVDAGRTKGDDGSRQTGRHSCTRLQTQYVVQGDETCFTLRALPICRSGCQQRGTVTKDIPVHCVQTSSATNLWKKEIQKGASPDFSLKPQSRTIKMDIPQRCSN